MKKIALKLTLRTVGSFSTHDATPYIECCVSS